MCVTPRERVIVQQGLQKRDAQGTVLVALAFDVHGTHVIQRILVPATDRRAPRAPSPP